MRLLILASLFLAATSSAQETNSTAPEDENTLFKETPAVSEAENKLIITSIKVAPFLTETKNGEFEGYVPDLMRHLAEKADFKFEIKLAADGKYGHKLDDGSFNGMIGDVLDGKADMAVAPLTVTFEREEVLDFTKPFMNTGIIVVAAARTIGQNLGMFLPLTPFTVGVWFLLCICFFAFVACLFLLNLFNPNEWKLAFVRGKGSIKEAQAFNVHGAFWFALTTLTWQGYDKAPRSKASKVLVGFWFCFVIITLILYTSAMVSIVGSAKPQMTVTPFEDLAAMSESGEYDFAAIFGGSTWSFLKNSQIPLHERIYADLGRVNNEIEGVEKARSGKWAFLGESPMLQKFLNNEPCDLVKIGYALDSKAYAIGLPQGSAYKEAVNNAILALQEDGTLQMLYNKWWKKDNTCPEYPEAAEGYDTQSGGTIIDEYRFSGAIIILLIGVFVSFVVALLEYFLYKRKTTPRKPKEQLIEAEEGQALNETAQTALESTRIEEKDEEAKDEKRSDDVGMELEPEDKEEKEEAKKEDEDEIKEEGAEKKEEETKA